MGRYPKTVCLNDGTEVLLRPIQQDDLDRSHRFFLTLPEEDRLHLKIDVTDRESVAIRMEPSDALDHWRLVALSGDEIIGDATLDQPRYGWRQHTAEIRCNIAHPFQSRGLGSIMLRELFQEEDVVVMTVSIADVWRRMEDLMQAMDGHGRETY
jgi:hypothetical protein